VQRPAIRAIPQDPRLIWQSQPVLTRPCFTVLRMAKAAQVLAALKRDGWIETRRSGSHRVLAKGDQQRIWAYHDGVDLGGPAMARIARDYGYTLAELRKL
jgi:predicted RNA binding protein YcfA (HicA-like mRNA interferase family)